MRFGVRFSSVFALSFVLAAGPVDADPLVLTFTGDLMAHAKNQAMADYDDIYRALSGWLHSDDLSFINLETPIEAARPVSDYPQFNAHPAYLLAAVRGGFDVFALANNHSNDYGNDSVDGTLSALTKVATPLSWSGLREKTGTTLSPVVIEKKGWKIGFLSLTNLVNRWPGAARVNLVSVWDIWSKKAHLENQRALLKKVETWKAGVDVLVVAFHDGVEYATQPDPIQVAFYQQMVEAGVDVFWGHHPHVLQPWKWVTTDRGPRLLMYSLGNFLSRQSAGLGPQDSKKPAALRGDGALMQVTLTKTATQTGTDIGLSVVPIPLNNYLDPQKGTIVVPTEVLTREAPEAWRAYYRQRWAVQRAWMLPGD